MLIHKRRNDSHGSQSGSPPANRALFWSHSGCSGGSTHYWGRCNRPRLNGPILKAKDLGHWAREETLGRWLLCFRAALGSFGSFRGVRDREGSKGYVDKPHERRAGGFGVLNAGKG